MKPVSLTNPSNRSIDVATKGGHWLYPDAKVGTHAIGEIEVLQHGYFDLGVKHIRSPYQANMKTFFPYGSTPDECVDMMLEAIKYMKKPANTSTELCKKSYDMKNKFGQIFTLHAKNGIATFYPVNEKFYKGILCK